MNLSLESYSPCRSEATDTSQSVALNDIRCQFFSYLSLILVLRIY
jgi:hypothetical protein